MIILYSTLNIIYMMRLFLCLIAGMYAAATFAINLPSVGKNPVQFKKEYGCVYNKPFFETDQNNVPANFPTAFIKWALKKNQYNIGKTYMWKSVFETTVNDTLLSQLNNYGIDTLLLSPGNNATKITDFLTKAQNQNIHVSRLLSENSYAKDANGVQKFIAKMQTLQYDFPGLHLNIEPHTFADYKANIPFYTARMDSIYDVAKQWCDPRNMKLTVSIPMHLPLQNAAFLANNDITAYIMAYENTDQQKLLTRTQILRATLQNKYVWVLRISDFANQQDLLDAVAYLNANGVSRVALYDFSTISNLF